MESGEQEHYIGLDNDVLWRGHNAGGCTHSWGGGGGGGGGGVHGPSLFCMHLGSFKPPAGSAAPQLEAPSDHRVYSIHNSVLVEHCSFLIGLLCSYLSVA